MKYDKQRADHAVDFINLLKHTGDFTGQSFNLRDWQEKEIIRPIFGNIDDDGNRIITDAFIMLPKKQGKSELLGAIAIYMASALGLTGQKIVIAASSRDQAALIFDVCAQMVYQEPELHDKQGGILTVYESKKRIVNSACNNVIVAISADASRANGHNPSVVLYDEVHAATNKKLWGVLSKSMGTRANPLWISITHAGFDKSSLAFEQFEYAVKVKEGTVKNPHFLPVLYYAKADDDWTDPRVWARVNPALGDFFSLDQLKSEFEKAKEMPSEENDFRMYHLNQWVGQSIRWIPMNHWRDCTNTFDPDILEGRTCFGGLDLGRTSDFSAFVLVFPPIPEDPKTYVLCWFWLPEEAAKGNPDYQRWHDQGFMKITDGNIAEHSVIEMDILEIVKNYDVQGIGVDAHQADWIATRINNHQDLVLKEFGNNMKSMSPPSNHLDMLILSHQLAHNNHPVLTWMASNVMVKRDEAGNIRPIKQVNNNDAKVDGIISLVYALGKTIGQDLGPSAYDQPFNYN